MSELTVDSETTAALAKERQEIPIEMTVDCPRCGATMGRWCKTARYQNSGVPFHRARVELAARVALATGPRTVNVVTDLSSRWFEVYADADVAAARAKQMNDALGGRYHRDRYQVSRVPVYRSVGGQSG